MQVRYFDEFKWVDSGDGTIFQFVDESGEYVRGLYYVAVLPRGIIHVGQRPPSPARVDTNK